MIHAGTATAVHDLSDGGLLIALAEMAMASGIGAKLLAAPSCARAACLLVRRGPGALSSSPCLRRRPACVLAKMRGCEVPCVRIGTTGGDAIAIAGETPVPIDTLRSGVRALAAGVYGRQGGVERSPSVDGA